ncbi:hypothetical protein ACLOJK_018754 [Asimina triloba]
MSQAIRQRFNKDPAKHILNMRDPLVHGTLSTVEKLNLSTLHFRDHLNLARVIRDLALVDTAAHFWIPSLGVFCFGNVELSPSLKEVLRLTGLPLSQDVSLVLTGPVGADLFHELFGIHLATFDLAADDEPPALSPELFYEFFSTNRGVLPIFRKPLIPTILTGIHEGLSLGTRMRVVFRDASLSLNLTVQTSCSLAHGALGLHSTLAGSSCNNTFPCRHFVKLKDTAPISPSTSCTNLAFFKIFLFKCRLVWQIGLMQTHVPEVTASYRQWFNQVLGVAALANDPPAITTDAAVIQNKVAQIDDPQEQHGLRVEVADLQDQVDTLASAIAELNSTLTAVRGGAFPP